MLRDTVFIIAYSCFVASGCCYVIMKRRVRWVVLESRGHKGFPDKLVGVRWGWIWNRDVWLINFHYKKRWNKCDMSMRQTWIVLNTPEHMNDNLWGYCPDDLIILWVCEYLLLSYHWSKFETSIKWLVIDPVFLTVSVPCYSGWVMYWLLITDPASTFTQMELLLFTWSVIRCFIILEAIRLVLLFDWFLYTGPNLCFSPFHFGLIRCSHFWDCRHKAGFYAHQICLAWQRRLFLCVQCENCEMQKKIWLDEVGYPCLRIPDNNFARVSSCLLCSYGDALCSAFYGLICGSVELIVAVKHFVDGKLNTIWLLMMIKMQISGIGILGGWCTYRSKKGVGEGRLIWCLFELMGIWLVWINSAKNLDVANGNVKLEDKDYRWHKVDSWKLKGKIHIDKQKGCNFSPTDGRLGLCPLVASFF